MESKITANSVNVNVRDFGAAGDGKTMDTAALQAAIDQCAQAGGGTVFLPPGTYLSGSLLLKSHVELHLGSGATLLSSPHKKDYIQRLEPSGGADSAKRHAHLYTCNLIYAEDSENIALTGRGTIDGNGRAFFTREVLPNSRVKGAGDWRPGHLISIFRSSDLVIENVKLVDSPCYSIMTLSCRRVRMTGLTILNDRAGPNTDGIDPVGCQDVVIRDCFIDAGDDCIAPKSGHGLLSASQPMDGLVVSNCVLSSTTCAVRIGYEGDGPIRNCTFSNLVIKNTRTGINMMVPHVQRDGVQCIEHGPTIENINFDNIVMETRVPLYLWVGQGASRPGAIRNVMISNVQASGVRGSYIGGTKELEIENVRLRNIHLKMRGTMNASKATENIPDPYPAWDLWEEAGSTWPDTDVPFKGLPHALYVRHARNVNIKDMEIDWAGASGTWAKPVRTEHSSYVRLAQVDQGNSPKVLEPPKND